MVSPSAACHTANGFREREGERAKVIVDGDWRAEKRTVGRFVLFVVFGFVFDFVVLYLPSLTFF